MIKLLGCDLDIASVQIDGKSSKMLSHFHQLTNLWKMTNIIIQNLDLCFNLQMGSTLDVL